MLTLPEIKSVVLHEAAGLKITRANYAEIADRVIAPVDVPIYRAKVGNDEEKVYREAQSMSTEDWLDIACSRVAINQMKQAIKKLTPAPLPQPKSPVPVNGIAGDSLPLEVIE